MLQETDLSALSEINKRKVALYLQSVVYLVFVTCRMTPPPPVHLQPSWAPFFSVILRGRWTRQTILRQTPKPNSNLHIKVNSYTWEQLLFSDSTPCVPSRTFSQPGCQGLGLELVGPGLPNQEVLTHQRSSAFPSQLGNDTFYRGRASFPLFPQPQRHWTLSIPVTSLSQHIFPPCLSSITVGLQHFKQVLCLIGFF